MKYTFLILITVIITSVCAQDQKATNEELGVATYLMNESFYVRKFKSIERYENAKDSCYRFLQKYPNSFARADVFRVLFTMVGNFSTDEKEILQVADSLLKYDNLPFTKVSIAEKLINKTTHLRKAVNLLNDGLSELENNNHLIRGFVARAEAYKLLGNINNAKMDYYEAIKIDSSREDLWQALAGISTDELESGMIKEKIHQIREEMTDDYREKSLKSEIIGRNILSNKAFNLKGEEVSLASLKSKITVINFFGFWCSWCVKEFPHLLEFQEKYPDVNVIFMADKRFTLDEIDSKYLQLEQFRFLKKQNFVISELNKELGINAVPRTIVLDKDGNIRYDYSGYNENIAQLLEENVWGLE